ncbi:KAP family P-loop domain-containing protein [Nostoc linckia z18]|uniref:KAP family P-loop domain-containing protein n=2 Tax=Nostoc linckia TaxID=92942 RepID=A0A9Q5Z6T7_NOSLI|nr:AAA family ATPase [Nostoc linckia]PHK28205.1 KAP family P-loop domain-containing protein [Nostoc linckia z15]PHK45022.1 KAP family P-loop domain-containing protein [Nostoc linckia z16]PHJ58045.1 KAP family P-loop domain-containing protein [Nostoc linckia z3]PHJ61673.1 KAP family P-loop domain-containing protein [Nostoc linckia z1]PHJ76758.1 KAP family P-loop domain-containing protein [Nostoc linckia z2]
MSIDLRAFFQASDPSRTLFVNNMSDVKYYIDFSGVRGGDIIGKLKQKITFFKPNEPTCTLFTGHIGCGKSTELLRLQAELEKSDFQVVYFESSEDLEMTDVDIADVLLAIARRVSQSLDKITLEETSKFNDLLQGAWKVLNSEVTGAKVKLGGVDVGVSGDKEKLSLAFGIGEITTKMKSDPTLRTKLNQYLAPQKTTLLEAINRELLEPAIAKLKQQGKQGLVVIVDNLDRIDNRVKAWGRPQQEYLFVDQGEFLTKLNCHLIYTMPLSLKFSNDYGMLTQRFPEDPKVLPMVPLQWPDGSVHEQGMALMKQMVLARAFPDLQPDDRLSKITEVFDNPATLDRLCKLSGGHVRDLLRLLNTWIMEEMALPLSRDTLDQVIRARRNEMIMPISDEEWQLLRHVKQNKKVSDDQGYQKLIRSRFVFEYRDSGESWFDVNPILQEARELQ